MQVIFVIGGETVNLPATLVGSQLVLRASGLQLVLLTNQVAVCVVAMFIVYKPSLARHYLGF